MNDVHRSMIVILLPALAASVAVAAEPPERSEPVPVELERVGVEEHLGDSISLNVEFTDERGKSVRLGDYFRGNRPVVLNLGYFRCPMLCGLVLNGLVDAAGDTKLAVGDDYSILTISVDPNETHQLAYLKKKNALEALGTPGAAAGWHFLTGKPDAIEVLTKEVGFGYQWVERRKEFAHTAVLVILTPDGRISRYLYGIKYPQRTYRLSLIEAAAGKIGSAMDQILLYCFQYDRHAGQYTLAAMNVMRIAAVFSMLLLGSFIGIAFLRESRRGSAADRTRVGVGPRE